MMLKGSQMGIALGLGPMLAAWMPALLQVPLGMAGGGNGSDFHPFFFLLPPWDSLLNSILYVELAWLIAMAVYGYVLRKLVRNPRDSVVVFHRIFWRIFVNPKQSALLEAYEKPMSVAALDDFDTPVLDLPEIPGLDAPLAPRRTAQDTAAGTAAGTAVGTMALGGVGALEDLDAGPPPEPAPIRAEQAGEAQLNVELVPNSPGVAIQQIVGNTLTLRVPCGGEDGMANRYVVQALCQVLQIESYQITLLRGHAKPLKELRIAGLSLTTVQQRLMR